MIKNWQIVASAAVATAAILGILGFNTPASAVAEMRGDIKTIAKRVDAHDVKFATMEERLIYISDGIDDLRGKPRRRK